LPIFPKQTIKNLLMLLQMDCAVFHCRLRYYRHVLKIPWYYPVRHRVCFLCYYSRCQNQGEHQIIIFGIVSNGITWQIGKLENEVFTRNSTYYTIQELDKLFAAVNFVFQQSELQLNNLVLSAA
ncbi:MAG: hypothetical protein ACKPCP_23890, partial [Sphaerospermopsis kisseleviana]